MFKSFFSKPRTFAIGDVHGCAAELQSLISQIDPRPSDTLVFLGDYVDRGPDSRGVVDLVLSLQSKCQVIALKGNHESMFLDFLESPDSIGSSLFILNGGQATLDSYAGPDGSFEIPKSHVDFFYGLELKYETDEYFFVHAGVPLKPLRELDESADEKAMLWSRQPFLSSKYKWEKMIVHGHTPVLQPEVKANRINLDTGCVFDGQLTALEFPSRRFLSVARGEAKGVQHAPDQSDRARLAVRFKGRLAVKASKPGMPSHDFETLNYNQFGLLMRDTQVRAVASFEPDDVIEGQIGLGPSAISFQGRVARVESRADVRLYAVRIDRATNGNDGREWVERPTGS